MRNNRVILVTLLMWTVLFGSFMDEYLELKSEYTDTVTELMFVQSELNIISFNQEDITYYGYEVSENLFVNNKSNGDANIYVPIIDEFVESISINFDEPLSKDIQIQVYYTEQNSEGFSEERVEVKSIKSGEKSIYLSFSKHIYNAKIDISTNIGDSFNFESIIINDINYKNSLIEECFYTYKIALFESIINLLMVSVILLSFYLLFFSNIPIHRLYWVVGLCIGGLYLLIMTPLAVPDEVYHLRHSYGVASLIIPTIEDAPYHASWSAHINNKEAYFTFMTEIFANVVESNLTYLRGANLSGILKYFPQAIGIIIAELLGFNFILAFYMGSLSNLLFYVTCVSLSIKRIPAFKSLLFMIGLLPMVLHQAASLSYDTISNGLSILFISEVLFILSKKEQLKLLDFKFIPLIGAILFPAKVVYVILILLLMIIPRNRFPAGKKFLKSIFLIFVVSVIPFLVSRLPYLVNLLDFSNEKTSIVPWSNTPGYDIKFILENPIETIDIFKKTFDHKGECYIYTAIGSSLAGLNLNMNSSTIRKFILLLFMATFNRKKGEELCFNMRQKMVIFAICFLTTIAIMLSMFISWTPSTYQLIEGVQGRYFIPIIPLVMLLFTNKIIIYTKDIDKYIIFVAVLLHMSCLSWILEKTI